MEKVTFKDLIDKYICFRNASKRSDTATLHANVFLHWCQKRFSGAEYLTQEADKLLPNRRVLFPNENDESHRNKWLSHQFFVCWYKYNATIAFARELRHQYAIENINSWTNEEYHTYDKLVALKNSMGHTKLSRNLYYYSMVPAYGQLIEERCGKSFSELIPNFDTYEE